MNFENKGRNIAVIKSPKKEKKLFVDFDPDNPKFFNTYRCKDKESIQQVPVITKESKRNILYICGASGSGKSYYATQYLKEYRKYFPNNPIYFFSAVSGDFGKDIKGLRRVRLGEEFIKTELTLEDFKDSCLVYDDTDVIRDKALRNKLDSIADKVLQTGRHYNISMIFTNHLAYNGKETKMILSECHSITFFPSTLGGKARKYLLENYLGMDSEEIKKLRKLPSRWITIVKGAPLVALYEKGALVLNQLE